MGAGLSSARGLPAPTPHCRTCPCTVPRLAAHNLTGPVDPQPQVGPAPGQNCSSRCCHLTTPSGWPWSLKPNKPAGPLGPRPLSPASTPGRACLLFLFPPLVTDAIYPITQARNTGTLMPLLPTLLPTSQLNRSARPPGLLHTHSPASSRVQTVGTPASAPSDQLAALLNQRLLRVLSPNQRLSLGPAAPTHPTFCRTFSVEAWGQGLALPPEAV